MRVLFVSAFMPSRIKVRPLNFVRCLSENHQVTLIAPLLSDRDRESVENLRSMCERVIAPPVSKPRRLLNYARGVFATDPIQAFEQDTGAMRAAVSEEARRGYDVVHVEHMRAVRLVQNLPPGLARVWDAIDSISLLLEGMRHSGPSLPLRAAARLELGRTRRFEARGLRSFERVLVAAERDRVAFEALDPVAARESLRVVPNVADVDFFAPQPVERDPETILISGTMSYHPNVSAALYLAHQVMPLVWARRPNARLQVVGADPTPTVQALAGDPRIQVTGFVPDIRPYMARATVAVSSTVYGAGIQFKVLEAMAMHTPVVASPSSAAGLQAEPGKHFLVAETPEQMAAAIVDVIERPEWAREMGVVSRGYVERFHSLHEQIRLLVQAYEEARQIAATREAGETPALPG